jgi:glycosyltransferase
MISLYIFKSNVKGINYGIGTYINQLTKSLYKFNYKIFIVNYFSEGNKEFSVNQIKPYHTELIIPLPVKFEMNDINSSIYGKRIVDILLDNLDKNSIPIFIFNYPGSVFIVRQLKARISAKIISIVHFAEWQNPFMGNKQKLNRFWELYISGRLSENIKKFDDEKEFYELSDRIVSVTDYMKDFISKFYYIPHTKIIVIQNGLDSAEIKILDKQQKNRLKQQLGFKSNEKVVLYAGRIGRVKGIPFLIDSFRKVIEKNKNVRLIIIGEVAGFDKFSQHLSQFENICSKITFTGYLVYEKILGFYQIADLGIIPSVYDHCPYTALEMIGHDIPLIISNTEGLNEILTGQQSVYLNPKYDEEGNISFDIEEMADSILSLINSSGKRRRIRRDYQSLIKGRFSSARMAEEMNKLFLSLV